MIRLSDIYIQYGDRKLFDHCSYSIEKGEKIALIGRNGAGKSTLLKIINGDIIPDEGSIQMQKDLHVGYLRQELNNDPYNSIRNEAKKAFNAVNEFIEKLDHINRRLENGDFENKDLNDLLEEQSELFDRIQILGGNQIESETEKVLVGLGFRSEDLDRSLNEFSGGWQMRVELAKLLLSKPDLLLLDEPTNHLDIESIIWLENYLKKQTNNLILISHDTHFLNSTCSKTLEIDNGRFYDYKASYYKYIELREERISQQMAALKNQQKEIDQKERIIKKFIAKANKTKMAQSMQKQLDKMDKIEIDQFDSREMNLRFPDAPRSGRDVVKAKCSKNYGELKVLEDVVLHLERTEKIAFVGQNGMGKSTFAKMIVGDLEPSKGEIHLGSNVQIGYYAQNQTDALDRNKTLLECMEDVSDATLRPKIRSILGSFLFSGEDVEKKVSVLSGGEKARLALAMMCLKPFNLLVMDEPTNHLDINAKAVLKSAIESYNGTCIIVSHDRDFLAELTEKTIEFRDGGIKEYLGDINYFLEKREMDSIRAFELEQKKENAKVKSNDLSTALSREQKKKIQRKIQYLERDIAKLEEQIDKIHHKMLVPDFYKDPKHKELLVKMSECESSLQQKMEEWEQLVEQFEV